MKYLETLTLQLYETIRKQLYSSGVFGAGVFGANVSFVTSWYVCRYVRIQQKQTQKL